MLRSWSRLKPLLSLRHNSSESSLQAYQSAVRSTSKNQQKLLKYQEFKKRIEANVARQLKKQQRSRSRVFDPLDRIKLRFDPSRENSSFRNFGIAPVVAKRTQNLLGRPTSTQRRILSILSSSISVVSRSNQGSGKTVALILYALSLPRLKIKELPATSSVLLVPSTTLVHQYKAFIDKILGGFQGDTFKVVQFLYRGTEQEESDQLSTLHNYPSPHILVCTPQRLLDLISSHKDNPDFIPLSTIRFVACDDADFLLLSDKSLHGKPASILLDYISKLHSSDPIQFAFISSISASDALPKLAEKWCQKRPVLSIGTPSTDIPHNVEVSCCLGSEKLEDAIVRPIATGTKSSKTIASEIGREFDSNYKKYILTKASQKKIAASILELTRHVPSLTTAGEKSLIVYPESVPLRDVKDHLEKTGCSMDDVFLSTPSHLPGVCFGELSTVIVLGQQSVVDSNMLAMLCGRIRTTKTGVVDSQKGKGRLTFLFNKGDFGYMERYALERMLLKVGLKGLTRSLPDQEVVDLKTMDDLFQE